MLDRARAADAISDLADHAVTLARGAGSAALPTVQRGAESLSQVLQSAAGTLAETAEQIAADGRVDGREQRRTGADRRRVRQAEQRNPPKKKTHRVRNLLIGAAVVGGVFALIQSPLRAKIQERLFGPAPSDDDDLPQITLPDDDRSCRDHRSDQGNRRLRPTPARRCRRYPGGRGVGAAGPAGATVTTTTNPQTTRRPMPDDRPYQGRPSSDRPSFSGPRQFSGPRPNFNNDDSRAALPPGAAGGGSGRADVALAAASRR